MLTPLEVRGTWWVAGNPDHQVPGVLHLAGDRFDLETHGGLLPDAPPEPGASFTFFEYQEAGVVYGRSHDRETAVTLLGCQGHGSNAPIDVIGEMWRPTAALVGAHLGAEPRFDRVVTEIENLAEWAGVGGVQGRIDRSSDGQTIAVHIDALRESLSGGEIPSLGCAEVVAVPTFETERRRVVVELAPAIRVTPSAPVSWETAFQIAAKLRDLVRLSVAERSAVVNVRLQSVDRDERDLPVWVDLELRTTALGRERPDPVRPWNVVCPLRELPGGFAAGLTRWLQIRERLLRPWSLLTSQDEDRFVTDEEHFIARERTVEAIHAVDFGRSEAARAQRDERVRRALEAIPEELIPWATPLLEASTPPQARHSIIEVAHAVDPLGTELAGGDVEAFARRVIQTRNDVTHPSRKGTNRGVLVGEDRFWHGEALYWIAHLYFLAKLGLSVDELGARLPANSAYSQVVRHMAQRRAPSAS